MTERLRSWFPPFLPPNSFQELTILEFEEFELKKEDDNFTSMFSNFAVTATSCPLMETIFQEASCGLFMFSSCPRADVVKQKGRNRESRAWFYALDFRAALCLAPASSGAGAERGFWLWVRTQQTTWQDLLCCCLCKQLSAVSRFERREPPSAALINLGPSPWVKLEMWSTHQIQGERENLSFTFFKFVLEYSWLTML